MKCDALTFFQWFIFTCLNKSLIGAYNKNSFTYVLHALNVLKMCGGKIVLGCVWKLTFKYIYFTKAIITAGLRKQVMLQETYN